MAPSRFFSTVLLGLGLIAPTCLGAAIEIRDTDHVNYYSDPRCKNWIGQWDSAGSIMDNAVYNVGGQFVGSVMVLPSDKFDSLKVDGKGIVAGGQCAGDQESPILIDANGYPCYLIQKNVNKVELFSGIPGCAIIPSS
ncbi:hypothetical protein B7463_g4732, partial [Scytalidium lignicola]